MGRPRIIFTDLTVCYPHLQSRTDTSADTRSQGISVKAVARMPQKSFLVQKITRNVVGDILCTPAHAQVMILSKCSRSVLFSKPVGIEIGRASCRERVWVSGGGGW